MQLENDDTIREEFIKVRLMVMNVSGFKDIDYEENYGIINISDGAISKYDLTENFPTRTRL
ncbi:hypothetical protein M9Y10_006341 [Tritrichomonas musculus]|uniref:Uncharacterized protein n=1 Tax=Tritrichomonas musculus TaxID=1915356 RepID=A0ABR2JEY2_9EUKA